MNCSFSLIESLNDYIYLFICNKLLRISTQLCLRYAWTPLYVLSHIVLFQFRVQPSILFPHRWKMKIIYFNDNPFNCRKAPHVPFCSWTIRLMIFYKLSQFYLIILLPISRLLLKSIDFFLQYHVWVYEINGTIIGIITVFKY